MARRSSHGGRIAGRVLAVLAVAVLVLALWRVGPAPEIEIEPALPGIGPRTPVEVRLREPSRGLSSFRVELVQGASPAEAAFPSVVVIGQ